MGVGSGVFVGESVLSVLLAPWVTSDGDVMMLVELFLY